MAKKILIVEDDVEVNELLGKRLKANGYETVFAYDGEDGLDKAKTLKPDLVILDLKLPNLPNSV